MAAQIKQDCIGNYVHLKGTTLSFYHKDSGKLFKIVDCLNKQSAKEEFQRVTNVHKPHEKRRHHQAKVWYAQLIIQC